MSNILEPAAREIPIERRIHTAYMKALHREGAPARMLDQAFNSLRANLGQCTNLDVFSMPTSVRAQVDAARAKLLEDGERLFDFWANLTDNQMVAEVNRIEYPQAPPPGPEQARGVIDRLEATRGVRLELWGDSFRVFPASKLEPGDKDVLTSLKPHILTELHCRLDAWSPK